MWVKGTLSQKDSDLEEVLRDFLNTVPIKKKFKNQYFKEEKVKVDICRVM